MTDAHSGHRWHIAIDGASRHNPGHAGVGIVITRDNAPVKETGFYLGKTTNNRAEYAALLCAIALIKKDLHPKDQVIIASDSELMVHQMRGRYRIRDHLLQLLHAQIVLLLDTISYTIVHIRREQNTHADAWANRAIDEKIILPSHLAHLLPPGFHT